MWWRLCTLALFHAALTTTRADQFPYGFEPRPPFIDQCIALNEVQCGRLPYCTWSTDASPQCILRTRKSVRPPDVWKYDTLDLTNKFFTFHWGVHLTEGKSDRRYYNTEVDECASLCLRAAGGLSDDLVDTPEDAPVGFSKRRCLSFDFFPFENPNVVAPFGEAMSRGICVLNQENSLSAKLRKEDTALTDAELFYISLPISRPFSKLDGYYEVKDLRRLDTGSGSTKLSWGQSRYGMAVLHSPKSSFPDGIDCTQFLSSAEENLRADEDNPEHQFFVGFTPTNRDNSCPGLVEKSAALQMCREAGGQLCPTQTAAALLYDKELGCNLDDEAVWTEEDSEDHGEEKYVRCCARYPNPPDCERFTAPNLEFCHSKRTQAQCIGYGSGYNQQSRFGFGKLLETYRDTCERGMAYSKFTNCRQVLMQVWEDRDHCVWCPDANDESQGSCRPGSDMGICPNATPAMKSNFAQRMLAYCSKSDVCSVIEKLRFADLNKLIQSHIKGENPDQGSETPCIPRRRTPCSSIRGRGARGICKRRHDCKWQRGRGSIYRNCYPNL